MNISELKSKCLKGSLSLTPSLTVLLVVWYDSQCPQFYEFQVRVVDAVQVCSGLALTHGSTQQTSVFPPLRRRLGLPMAPQQEGHQHSKHHYRRMCILRSWKFWGKLWRGLDVRHAGMTGDQYVHVSYLSVACQEP